MASSPFGVGVGISVWTLLAFLVMFKVIRGARARTRTAVVPTVRPAGAAPAMTGESPTGATAGGVTLEPLRDSTLRPPPPLQETTHEEPPNSAPPTSRRSRSSFEEELWRALARIEGWVVPTPEQEALWTPRFVQLRQGLGLREGEAPTEEHVASAIRMLWHATIDDREAGTDSSAPDADPMSAPQAAAAQSDHAPAEEAPVPRTPVPLHSRPPAGDGHAEAAPPASRHVLGAPIAGGVWERPGEPAGAGSVSRSARPPPHKPPRRTATLAGLADAAPPVGRSASLAPRREPPAPASGSAPPKPSASQRPPIALYATLPPPVPPPPRPSPAVEPAPARVEPVVLAPGHPRPAKPEDFDDPDEETRIAALPTTAELLPVEPSAAGSAGFDAADATVIGERPTAAELERIGLPELDGDGVVMGRVPVHALPFPLASGARRERAS